MPISLVDILSLVLTAGIGMAGLVSIFRHADRRINLPVLFLTFLFLYLGGGGCFSLLTGESTDLRNYMQLYDVAPGDITRGCFATMLHGLVLWFLAHVFRHSVVVSRAEIAHLVQQVVKQYYLETLLVGAAIVQVYALSTGTFGFEGVLLDTTTGEQGMASPWALLANWMSTSLAPACVFVAAFRRKITLPLLLGFLWNLGLVAIVSRRNFLSVVFISTLPLFIFSFSRRLRLTVIVSAAAVGVFAVIVFFSFRLSMWEHELDRTEVSGIVSGGVGLLRDGEMMKSRLADNVSTRTLNICYTSMIAKNAHWATGANGIILGYSVVSVVPTFLYPQKPYFSAIGGEEGVTMRVLAIQTGRDENNSIVTAALTDFGYLGLFVYSIVLYLIIALAVKAIRYTRITSLSLVGFCLLLFTLTDIENQFAAVLVSLRLIVVLCLIGGAWTNLLPKKYARYINDLSQTISAQPGRPGIQH
jgi:hypothetical protein